MSKMKDTPKFPTWFTILTALLVISNLIVYGLITLFQPNFAFPDAGESAVFPIQFFAARHIAFAFPLLYGLVRRDPKTLRVMYGTFIIMSVLDLTILGINGYTIPVLGHIAFIDQLPTIIKVALGSVIFLLPMVFGMRHLMSYNDR